MESRQLEREVEKGIQERESLEGTIEIKEKRLEGLERYGNKMDELRKEARKRGAEMSKRMNKMRNKKDSELQKYQDKETGLQNELRMLREEGQRTENETSRNHTVQIEQFKAKARLECAEMRKKFEEKTSELQKHQDKERELQNELRMVREERTTAENETLRNHTA